MMIMTSEKIRPTMTVSRSVVLGLIRFQMSRVKMALVLLNMEVREDMRAARRAANIKPRRPEVATKRGNEDEGLYCTVL